MREAGIVLCEAHSLSDDDRTWLDAWFMERVFPVLTPLAIDPAHPFPFIPNMGLVMALLLVRAEDRQGMRAMLPLPAQVDRFIRLPANEGKGRDKAAVRFILLEELVLMFLDRVFPGFTVNGGGMFRLIRDTDVEFEEEAEDLVRSYETALKRRRRSARPRSTAGGSSPRASPKRASSAASSHCRRSAVRSVRRPVYRVRASIVPDLRERACLNMTY